MKIKRQYNVSGIKGTRELINMLPYRIVMEDLNVKGMMKNKHLVKYIQQQKLFEFKTLIKYKSNKYGINFIEVNRWYPSSKICSQCGTSNKNLKLSDRIWICNNCNIEHDRDINAAKNIKKFALQKQNLIGMDHSKSTLAESSSLESQ